jgi:hypothetical protein
LRPSSANRTVGAERTTVDDGGDREGKKMKFGFCIMADIDEIGFFPFIEGLGYDSAWVADSQ